MQRSIILGVALLLALAAPMPLRAQTAPAPAPESITTRLSLTADQIERFDRLYASFARTRLEQEAKMAGWQDELKQVQAVVPPDERRAARLVRNITRAEEKIALAFLKARGEALKRLTPDQRARLQGLKADLQAVRDDKYRQLLLLTVEEIWRVPVDTATARELLDEMAYAARSPRRYRYFGSPYLFSSYGYGWGSYPFFGLYGHGGFFGGSNHDTHHDGHVTESQHHGPGAFRIQSGSRGAGLGRSGGTGGHRGHSGGHFGGGHSGGHGGHH